MVSFFGTFWKNYIISSLKTSKMPTGCQFRLFIGKYWFDKIDGDRVNRPVKIFLRTWLLEWLSNNFCFGLHLQSLSNVGGLRDQIRFPDSSLFHISKPFFIIRFISFQFYSGWHTFGPVQKTSVDQGNGTLLDQCCRLQSVIW